MGTRRELLRIRVAPKGVRQARLPGAGLTGMAPVRAGLVLVFVAGVLAGCFVVPAPPPPGPGLRPAPPSYVAATPECGWQYGVGWYGWGWYGFGC